MLKLRYFTCDKHKLEEHLIHALYGNQISLQFLGGNIHIHIHIPIVKQCLVASTYLDVLDVPFHFNLFLSQKDNFFIFPQTPILKLPYGGHHFLFLINTKNRYFVMDQSRHILTKFVSYWCRDSGKNMHLIWKYYSCRFLCKFVMQ